ncbi:MAG: T9SS type A sorting domain-containing protein, partial [Bacteroidota bacterium]
RIVIGNKDVVHIQKAEVFLPKYRTIREVDRHPIIRKYLGFLDVYNIFVTNDNTANRFSFSWQQAFSEGAIGSDNITNTPVVLFQVVLNYGPGGENEIDGICFESSDLFDDQTFTACGPADPGIADCFSASGTQLTSDNFDCLISLPIELLSFDVQALEDQTSYLEWQTSTEINNDFFTVERAFDGIQFEPIERINGAGNSQQLLQYKTIDPKPQIGVNYYRLKQTDFDGTFTYSEIRTVKFEHQASLAEGTVFPNPATEFVYIRLNEPIQQGRVHLIDVRGQILIEKALTGSDLLQLTVDQMPSGLYWVR